MQFRIKSKNIDMSNSTQKAVERCVRFELSRFANRIGRVIVRLERIDSVHGPTRIGCRLTVQARLGVVVVEALETNLKTAVERASGRANDSVARNLLCRTPNAA